GDEEQQGAAEAEQGIGHAADDRSRTRCAAGRRPSGCSLRAQAAFASGSRAMTLISKSKP
ncbi:MAG: hypothetical protein REU00_14330, partial [Pseudomonadota bacterium]|nr:hypothetical protein [Pseudomonadota bacterium]